MSNLTGTVLRQILNNVEDIWKLEHSGKFNSTLLEIRSFCRHKKIVIVECYPAGHGFTSLGICQQCQTRFYYDG